MKVILTTFAVLLAAPIAQARLGENRDQSEARYGLPKSERVAKGVTPLLEGARELTFHHQGFRIRCAFLTATDGQEYVVREEYIRMAARPAINDVERDAILEGEKNGQTWTFKPLQPLALSDFRKPVNVRVETKMTSLSSQNRPAEILEAAKPAAPVVAKAPAKAPVAVVPFEQQRSPASPYILASSGLTWARPDGATASLANGGYPMRLDLPQAAKYEAELNAAKEQKEKAILPKF